MSVARPPNGDQLKAVSLDRASAADLLARHLHEEILHGHLQPGAPLREGTLAERFDVSRNTVREAFRVLERDRLISHEAHRGVTVREIRAEEVSDLYRVRTLLEMHGLSYARTAVLDPVRRAVEDGERFAALGDDRQTVNADLDFHRAIVALAGSARISEMFDGLMVEVRLGLSVIEDTALGYWLAENKRLLADMEAGRIAKAERVLKAYLQRSERSVVDRLSALAAIMSREQSPVRP